MRSKETLETDLPERGTRFRSVLDIMVSERVLFEIMLDRVEHRDIPLELLRKPVRASLQALTRSGSQEASEEAGVSGRRLIGLVVSLSRQQQCTLVAASNDPEVIRMAAHQPSPIHGLFEMPQ